MFFFHKSERSPCEQEHRMHGYAHTRMAHTQGTSSVQEQTRWTGKDAALANMLQGRHSSSYGHSLSTSLAMLDLRPANEKSQFLVPFMGT